MRVHLVEIGLTEPEAFIFAHEGHYSHRGVAEDCMREYRIGTMHEYVEVWKSGASKLMAVGWPYGYLRNPPKVVTGKLLFPWDRGYGDAKTEYKATE